MTEVRNKNDFNEYIESLLVNYESNERAPLKFRWSSYFLLWFFFLFSGAGVGGAVGRICRRPMGRSSNSRSRNRPNVASWCARGRM